MNEHDKAPEADATGEDELAKYWAEADAEDAKTDGDALPDRDEGSEDPDADLPPDVEDDETGRSGDQDKADEGGKDQTAKIDPWALAPPELREQYEALSQKVSTLEAQDHRHRSRQSELTRQLSQLKAPQAASPRDPAERKQKLDALREEYPEVATPLLEVIDDLTAKVSHLAQKEVDQQNSFYDAQDAKLRNEHGDYEAFLKEHADTWRDWVNAEDQPIRTHRILRENETQIADAAAVSDLLTKFKQHIGVETGLSNPPPPGGSSTALTDRRQRQLAGSVAPSRGTPPATTSDIPEDGDPQAIWDAIDREEARKAARR